MATAKRPPILVLGTSERVGSNWALDSLRHATIQHNEPVRQQLGRDHRLSPMATAPGPEASATGPLASYRVTAFQHSTYYGGQHVIKETNLYFTAAPFLQLFPDAPVVVLTRAPVGVASSFIRGALWKRWDYADTYGRVAAMTRQYEHGRWAALLADEAPPTPVALTCLAVLNAALLAEALGDREHAHVSYEAAVADRRTATEPLTRLVPDAGTALPAVSSEPPSADRTFATTQSKNRIIAHLTRETADLVASETTRCLQLVRTIASPATSTTVERWLAGNDAYTLAATATAEPPPPTAPPCARRPRNDPSYLRPTAEGLQWRNLLVSNAEMAAFLNALAEAGLANTLHGVHLLAIPMPHGRGGRLRPFPEGWRVSSGYEHHPAYWVTWIGAAAYALWEGARLPTSGELDAFTAGARVGNAEYRVGDVDRVHEPDLGPEAVHHRAGNLQVWCCDGPADAGKQAPVTRYLHGAAWNTPASRQEITRRRSRHLMGASRGVGVRLVRDSATGRRRSPEEIADRVNRWLTRMSEEPRRVADLDREAVALLAPTS
ncbi:SUMF1/EgtB/PvdO family nonheme iron enzyme [Streptomonospora salina]|uniref:Sulfatase-modifying factor enzyme-like domain-containing protein n=1 Tax=Streptomonospora salina TaxID=104205 RepID=A0A841EAX0_9ACTN|nr:SUMF1/EgtB/PvdO family nonheme iron enzyme [Streptomonospora salina]MBB5998479.1 hypothetical protein [Streptomonospora salina]